VRGDLTTEPPAHCRLVSDHDLFEIVVISHCTAAISASPATTWKGITRPARSKVHPPAHSPGETLAYDIPPEATRIRVRAPGHAGQGRPLGRPLGGSP
jgi:hypothetical protein